MIVRVNKQTLTTPRMIVRTAFQDKICTIEYAKILNGGKDVDSVQIGVYPNRRMIIRCDAKYNAYYPFMVFPQYVYSEELSKTINNHIDFSSYLKKLHTLYSTRLSIL